MSVSMRSMLSPGVALVTVGAVALGPTFAAPPPMAAPTAAPIPAVYVADVALAGIGRDIYNSLSATVQGLVQWAEFAVGLIPFLGGGIRGQIDINYFGLIQPMIANTVYALSNIIADPLGILTTVGSYLSNQVYVGYTWVTDQIAFFGLPPLLGPIPAPPRLASVGGSADAPAVARALGPRAAAALAAVPGAPAETTPVESAPAETTPVESAPAETTPVESAPAESAPAEVGTPARSVRAQARRVAVDARQSTQTSQTSQGTQGTDALEAPVAPAAAEAAAVAPARVPARATRGAPDRADTPSRDAAKPVASATG
ncbi:hypothetical protein MCEMAEM6B_01350 [Mycobacteriaceae bacterium]